MAWTWWARRDAIHLGLGRIRLVSAPGNLHRGSPLPLGDGTVATRKRPVFADCSVQSAWQRGSLRLFVHQQHAVARTYTVLCAPVCVQPASSQRPASVQLSPLLRRAQKGSTSRTQG